MAAYEAMGSPQLKSVCECAVGPYSLVEQFRELCSSTILVEPHPAMAEQARTLYPWATVHEVAIAREAGQLDLRKINGCSFIVGTSWAPVRRHAPLKAKRAEKVTVEAVTFDMIDDGHIDLLNLDCEGGEWFVIECMKSRPLMIHIEIYPQHGFHTEIMNWFRQQGYKRLAAKTRGANEIFVRV